MDALKESIRQLSLVFHQKMDSFESEYKNSNTEAASKSSVLHSEYAAFKLFILAALRSLQDQIELLDKGVDCIEMRSRQKMLLFHGLPEEKTENTAVIITKLVLEQLKIPGFSESDIARCHRMGRSTGPLRPRPILVKLRDIAMRSKIWSTKTTFKGSGVTVSEFLTRSRHQTFMAARERYGITKCWTRDGSIYVLDCENGRHRVSCMKELDSIAQPMTSQAKTTTGDAKKTSTPTGTTASAAPIKSRRAAAGAASKK